MKQKLNIAVIYGGTNTEHEVSIASAQSIIDNLDRTKYNILPVMINKDNLWLTSGNFLVENEIVRLASGDTKLSLSSPQEIVQSNLIDVFFPVLHGSYGEDGSIQGLFEMLHIPYVGCNVLSSALCMDKVIQKQLCQQHQLPVTTYLSFTKAEWSRGVEKVLKVVEAKLSYPVFVKPANQGSSIGVSKVKNRKYLEDAINLAFDFDTKVLIEERVRNLREIECAILGNDEPQVSVLGEIISSNEFYDYDAKYVDGNSKEVIPAELPVSVAKSIQDTALQTFKVLNCSGLARVDFLLNNETKKFYINEVNTMPGFTQISMYPKLWQASGLQYSNLLDALIELALEKYQQKSQISLSYSPKSEWYR